MTAALYGATVVNHLEVTGLEKDGNGKLCGARVRDLVPARNGEDKGADEFVVRAKGIINATGPFVDAVQQMDEPKKREIVAPSLGVHVVLPGYLSPRNMGLIDPSASDGRVIFFSAMARQYNRRYNRFALQNIAQSHRGGTGNQLDPQ